MNEKLGIEKLKMAAIFLCSLGNNIATSLEDGKINFVEGFIIGKSLVPLPGLIANAKNIKKEYADLDSTEYKALVAAVEKELDLVNEKAEDVIEAAFEFLVSIDKLFRAIKNKNE